jgi:hypothetical protein
VAALPAVAAPERSGPEPATPLPVPAAALMLAYTPAGLPVRRRKPRPYARPPAEATPGSAVPRTRPGGGASIGRVVTGATAQAPVTPHTPVLGTPMAWPRAAIGGAAHGGDEIVEASPNGRTPEEIRRMMAAYQAGARRGEAAAAGRPLPESDEAPDASTRKR